MKVVVGLAALTAAILFGVGGVALAQDGITENVELLSVLAPHGTEHYYNDIWGYVADGREYALMGHRLGTLIIDVTDPRNPVEIADIPGASSTWRDIKTHGHYAYIVHDANKNGFAEPGLQIVDLSALPEKAELVATYIENMGPGFSHNLYIDSGIAYLVGTKTFPAVIMLDLSDPVNPVEINTLAKPYWHDIFVQDGIIFASAVNARKIHILDVSNPLQLEELSQTTYPGAFTHNIWATSDNRYIVSTDEVHGRPVNFWDVTDLTAPEQVASYGLNFPSVAHNACINGDICYIAHYYDGLRVIDISRRQAPVEVGYFDTYPDDGNFRGFGFQGAWGIYPFLPSGNLIVSDITYGLYVLRFNGTRAGFMSGNVLDAETGALIPGTEVALNSLEEYEGKTTIRVNNDGRYEVGSRPARRDVRFFKYGYEELILEDIEFNSGATIDRDVELQPIPIGHVLLSVKTTEGDPLPGLKIRISSEVYDFSVTPATDGNGRIRRNLIYDQYHIELDTWGYLPAEMRFTLNQSDLLELEFVVQPGYLESFAQPELWRVNDPADSDNVWIPIQAKENEFVGLLPQMDFFNDAEGYYIYSRAQRGAAILTSPIFNGTRFTSPVLEFYRYFFPLQYENDPAAGDSLAVQVSSDAGRTWAMVDLFTNIEPQWYKMQYWLENYVTLSDSMQVRFIHTEGDSANRVSVRFRRPSWGAIDEVRIVPEKITAVHDKSDVADARTVRVFPNPAFNHASVEWRSAVTQTPLDLSVFDAFGRAVLTFSLNGVNTPDTARFTFSTTGLAPGTYFLRLRYAEHLGESCKFIVIK